MTVDKSHSYLADRPKLAIVVALAAGAIPTPAFPEPSLWWIAPAALVPAMLVVASAPSRRHALLWGWAAGTGYLIGATHWLAPKIGPGIVIFPGLVAVGFLPWAAAIFSVARRRRLPVLASALVVSSAWMISEAIRSWSSLGGPWGLYGATQYNNPVVVKLAAVGGVWLISVLLVALNWSIASAIRTRGRRDAIFSTVLVLAIALGAAALAPRPQHDGMFTVAGVQPGIGLVADERLRAQIELTRDLIGSDTDLVVWGESSIGIGLDPDEDTTVELSELSQAVGAPILVNVDTRRGEGGIFKTSTLVGPEGVIGTYDKIRMVPFGEYIPFRRALGWLATVSEAAAEDRRRGDRIRLMSLDSVAIGPLVCFESAFPDMSRALIRMGADVIVYQSATTTFQNSWAPEQHASLAALRAVETGRPVVHATLTGESAVFDATGRRLVSLPTTATGTYSATIPLATGTTPYVRFGDWVLVLSLVIVGGWAVIVVTTRPQGSDTRRQE